MYEYLWNCTARHNSCFPCAGTGLRVGYIIIPVWARVPCVTRACAVSSALFFFKKKKKKHTHTHVRSLLGPYTPACIQLWICGRVRAPARVYFRLLVFSFLFLRSYIRSICPMDPFRKKIKQPRQSQL